MRALRSRIAIFLLMIIFACAPKASQVATPPPSFSHEIQDIRLTHATDQTQVIVRGQRPMIYTSFHLAHPDRFVVDIAGVGLGTFTEKIVPDQGLARFVQPRGGVRNQGSQLEIGLSEPVETSVRTDGVNLIIEVARVARMQPPPPTPAPDAPPAVASESPAAPEVEPQAVLPQAQFLKDIRFERGAGLQMIVTADGLLAPRPVLIDKNRLVIDLPGVKPAMKMRTLPVSDPSVKQVRMGQHPDKIRLVLDLLAPVAYAFRQQDRDLVVFLRPAVDGEVSPASLASSALPPASDAQEAVGGAAPTSAGAAAALTGEAAHALPAAETTQDLVVPPPAVPPSPSAPPITPPESDEGGTPRYSGKRVSLDFQDADAANVLRLIGDVSGSNMVIGEDVKGKVNLRLNGVPWDQAMDIILKTNSLGQIREGNIIRIGTLASMTRQQDDEAKAKEAKTKAEDLTTRILYVNYSKAIALSEPLKKSLSPRGDITVDERTNAMIVKDIEKNVEEVARLVKKLDTPTPQVMIEARIVQVSPTFNRSLGIQWGANYNDTYKANRVGIGGVTFDKKSFGVPAPDFAVNLPASPTFGGVGFTFGRLTSNPFNLDLRLSAGESQGLTRIVSRPKVAVLDNQEAKISQGESIPFQTVSSQGTQTTFAEANLSLLVTPHITPDGSVMMKIKVTKDSPGPVQPGASGPSILKKEASTNVLVRDGDTTVIGGIYEKSQTESEDGLPWLKRLPVIGWLFKTEQKRDQISELLVFLTPKIVTQDPVVE